MANEVSVKVSTDAKSAVADFRRLLDGIHATETAARRAASGIDAMATSAGRVAARAAQARREIEQMTRASRAPQFGAATGRGFYGAGGGAGAFAGIGGAFAGIGSAVGVVGVTALAASSYSAARDEAQAQSFLASAARQTGQAYAQQAAEVDKLRRSLGLTTAQAMELRAATLRFTGTIGRPQEASLLATRLADALAASGRPTSEIPDRLRQLATGQDELFDVLGPVKIGTTFAGSPETIYKAYAKEILHVKRELTDLEKTQARYYAVLQAGEASVGAASARMATDVGRIETLTNRWSDLAAAIGRAVLSSRQAQTILGLGELATRQPTDRASSEGYIDLIRSTVASGVGSIPALPPAVRDAIIGLSDRMLRPGPTWEPRRYATDLRGQAGSLLGMFGVGSTQMSVREGPAHTYLGVDPFGARPVSLRERAIATQQAMDTYARARKIGMASLPQQAARVQSLYGEYFSLGSRLDEIRAAGGATPETAQGYFARLMSDSRGVRSSVEGILGSSSLFSAAEGRQAADRLSRQFLVAGLTGIDPAALSADQRETYARAIEASRADQMAQVAEELKTAKQMEQHLRVLREKAEVDERPKTIIEIENRTGAIARFYERQQRSDG